jgi:hypothetical protein
VNKHTFNACTENFMAETWLTYADLAKALGITPEAARQKAIRGRWRRQRGNDGKALVLVDVEAEKATHSPRRRPDEQLAGRPDDPRTIAALESHIATLKGNIAKAEAFTEQQHGEVEATRKRLDEMVAELVAMSKMMAGQSAAADSARAELAAYRSRSWWKRIAGWLEVSPALPMRRPVGTSGPRSSEAGPTLSPAPIYTD